MLPLILAQTATFGTFEDLKIPYLVGAASATQGSTTTFQGYVRDPQTLANVGQYQLGIADTTKIPNAPTPAQMLINFETSLRNNPQWRGQFLRTSTGTIGGEKIIVIDGSLVAALNGRASVCYVSAFAFVSGAKAYQMQAISLKETSLTEFLNQYKGMTLKDKPTAGLPTTTAGEYSNPSSPFSIRAAAPIFPKTYVPANPSFASIYNGAVKSDRGLSYDVVVATLRPDDKRNNAEIAAAMLRDTAARPVDSLLKVPGATLDAQIPFKDGEVEKTAHVRYERKGESAALICSTRVKTGYPFGGIELKVKK